MSGARRHRVSDGRDDLGIQVHSEIDDYGLDPYAFRVYARMARRAGGHGGVHWESVRKTAEACRMSPRRVHDALRLLEAQGLIHRVEGHERGETVEYTLTPRRTWAAPLTPAPDADPSAPPAHPSAPGADPPARDAHPPLHHVQTPSAPGADEVKPLKLGPSQDLPPNPPRGAAARKRAGARSKFDATKVELPPTVDPKAWEAFVTHRAERRRPLTSAAAAEILGGLVGEPRATEMLLTAVRRGWSDVYPPDPPRPENGPPTPLAKPRPPATADAAWQALVANGARDAPTTATLQALGRAGQDALGQIGWWDRVRDAMRQAKAGDEADLMEIELEFREAYEQALPVEEAAA